MFAKHYVKEKDLSDRGKYIDVISGGAEKAVKAWNQILDEKKEEVYKKYSK